MAAIGSIALVFWTSIAQGQQNTTVQLPTFNLTTASTTVTVPDRGTALLGGIDRMREGSVTRGVPMLSKVPGVNRLFTNRGIGREVGAMNMSVTPRIISLEEEELRQTGFSYDMLSSASGAGSGSSLSAHGGAVSRNNQIAPPTDPLATEVARKADFLTRNVARNQRTLQPPIGTDPRLTSLADIRQQNERAAARRSAEAADYFAQGQRAQAEGKTGVAKIYYQMAMRRVDPTLDLADQIIARLAALESESPTDSAMLVDRR
jgi:hypothetical protein